MQINLIILNALVCSVLMRMRVWCILPDCRFGTPYKTCIYGISYQVCRTRRCVRIVYVIRRHLWYSLSDLYEWYILSDCMYGTVQLMRLYVWYILSDCTCDIA